jgi:hypothetical protein
MKINRFARNIPDPTAADRLAAALDKAGASFSPATIATWDADRVRSAWRWLADREAGRRPPALLEYLEGPC